MTMLHIFLEFLIISIERALRECKVCILSFIQLAPKSMPCIWPISTDFQKELLSSNYNILHNFFVKTKSKLVHCISQTIFGIEDLVFMLRSIKQRAFFDSPTNFQDFFCTSYLLTNWLAYLYGRIQSPRPDVMPDRREGITRAAGFVFACIDTQAS